MLEYRGNYFPHSFSLFGRNSSELGEKPGLKCLVGGEGRVGGAGARKCMVFCFYYLFV